MKEIIKLPPFKRFCMTIGNLPSSYVESLSYAELLYWFCDFLQNKVIPAINNNAGAVQELQGLFTELQNYVNNYFENLDVQNEINNKLDEMVEEGILQEIISSYLNSKAVFCFDNVQNMKNANNLINGSYAQTLGFYNLNDGGSALYKIRTITNDDVVDDMFIIALQNNTLIAELIKDKKLNVLQLGVKRNVNENQSTRVNTLLAMDTKNILYFPSGRYYFTDGLVNNNRHDIVGDLNTVTDFDRQINGTRFYFNLSADDKILFDCTNGSRCSLRDIYVVCNNVEITLDKSLMSDGTVPKDIFTKTKRFNNITGIKLGNYGNQLINVAVYGCNLGIYGGTYNVFENIGAICCETGILLLADNVFTITQIQRCETAMILNGALNNISQTRLDSIRYNGLEINSNSNNIVNFIADICQYASIMLNNAQNNNIIGSIGRSGTYYANFEPSNDIEAGKACKVYLRNNCHNNSIKIMAYKSNALDVQSPILKIPTYVVATGIANDSNCSNNNIEITGQLFENSIPENQLLTLEQLDTLIHRYKGYLSADLKYEGIEYIITPTNNITENNLYVIKPIKYNQNYALLNANGNLDMNGHSINNASEVLMGDSANGWVSIARSSNQGNLKVQNVDNSYHRTDAQIIGVATPTTNTSAVNKDYVDNL